MALVGAGCVTDFDRAGGVRLSIEGVATSNEDVLGPVFCYRQTVQAPVAAYGETCEVGPPIQEE